MGFGIDITGQRAGARVTCDAPGCGAEVDWAPDGFAILSADGDIRIACRVPCRDRLRIEPNAGHIDLEEYIRSVVIGLGVEIEEDKENDAPDPRHLAAVLTELESIAASPGVPANLSVRKALEDGFIGPHHVARAWAS